MESAAAMELKSAEEAAELANRIAMRRRRRMPPAVALLAALLMMALVVLLATMRVLLATAMAKGVRSWKKPEAA